MQFYRSFIDNQWVESSDGARIDVADPSTNEVWAQVPACTAEDAARAVISANDAQKEWESTPAIERAAMLEKLNELLSEEREHFAKLLVREQGKTYTEALGEVDDTIGYMRYSASSARWLRGDIMPADAPNEHLMTFKVPYGVVIAICAYNYPLALIGRKVGPALVTGNTVVIKPHEATPVTASEFCRLVEKAGVPAGVINMVTGDGASTGAALVSHPKTRMITLTGSIPAGQRVAALAAKNLANLSLELGGKAPFIVMDDADLDAAAEAASIARFANCGQVCICNETILVHEAVADSFVEKLMSHVSQVAAGNPMEDGGMGPLSTPQSLERIEGLVESAKASGAEVLAGGRCAEVAGCEGGNWFEPTVLLANDASLDVIRDEIFGPVLPIMRVSSLHEAVEIANAREDGLSAYFWSASHSNIMKAIAGLETGTVFVNKGISGSFHGYHNGHKLSGIGGEDGPYGLENFLQKRSVYMSY
ncbi:aldehyde dehydrogenase family protein [Erythrobacter sp. W53]|uniref:aldehyde dehydrogenase family protein n=1 Tax=Erythrobacter sp. W53 TaxID=3425947 RepID=UPI003D769B28